MTQPDDEQDATGAESASDHNALLRRYGEAMVRIGDLEAELERLKARAGDRTTEAGHRASFEPDPSQPATADLAERIGSLERRLEDATVDPPPTSETSEGSSPGSEDAGDLGQLRLQVASLANQLAQAHEELQESQEMRGRTRRRRRSKSGEGRRPRWQFWRKSRH